MPDSNTQQLFLVGYWSLKKKHAECSFSEIKYDWKNLVFCCFTDKI